MINEDAYTSEDQRKPDFIFGIILKKYISKTRQNSKLLWKFRHAAMKTKEHCSPCEQEENCDALTSEKDLIFIRVKMFQNT